MENEKWLVGFVQDFGRPCVVLFIITKYNISEVTYQKSLLSFYLIDSLENMKLHVLLGLMLEADFR